MILYPAIDLKNGKCIRLKKGELNQVTFYNDNPVTQASTFCKSGVKWIHMVDIDGAFKGENLNHEIFIRVKNKLKCRIQVGGGIRSVKAVENLVNNKIDRVVIGTLAVKNPKLVKQICKMFPGKIAVGIDSRNGLAAAEGWTKTSEIKTTELAKIYEDAGVAAIIFTDINRDGILKGVNINEILELLNSTSVKVIASGGVSNLRDLEALKNLKKKNLDGAIVGRAIYEKKIDIVQALKLLKDK